VGSDGQHVLPRPRVEAVRIDANRNVVNHGDAAREAAQLPIQEPLQPSMEVDPIVMLAGEAVYGGRPRPAVTLGPSPPAGTKSLGQGIEDSEGGKCLPAAGAVAAKRLLAMLSKPEP
jgi:hypothetical protein